MPAEPFDPWMPVDVDVWIERAGNAGSMGSQDEPLGSKEKFWLVGPDNQSWLFKFARTSGGDRWVSGEDWAEVAACQLAALLGVPTATVRLATCDRRRGLLSQNLVPNGSKLEHGNELLSAANRHYEGGRSDENELYTVAAVKECLRHVGPPSGWPSDLRMTSFDVWAGYLVFDAWLAGTDRHDENWGAILSESGIRRLAPSFDHGNALGFQERPARQHRLAHNDRELGVWVARGRCRYFSGQPRLTDLARDALALSTAAGRRHWRSRLGEVTPQQVESVLLKAPDELLSESTRTFCTKMLILNRRRLLDET